MIPKRTARPCESVALLLCLPSATRHTEAVSGCIVGSSSEPSLGCTITVACEFDMNDTQRFMKPFYHWGAYSSAHGSYNFILLESLIVLCLSLLRVAHQRSPK